MRAQNRKFSQVLRGSRGAAQKNAKSAISPLKNADFPTPTEFRKSEQTGTLPCHCHAGPCLNGAPSASLTGAPEKRDKVRWVLQSVSLYKIRCVDSPWSLGLLRSGILRKGVLLEPARVFFVGVLLLFCLSPPPAGVCVLCREMPCKESGGRTAIVRTPKTHDRPKTPHSTATC